MTLREKFLNQWTNLKEKIKTKNLHLPKKTILLNDIHQWLTTNYEEGKSGLTSLEKQRADIMEPYLSETDYQELRKLEKKLEDFVTNIWNQSAWVREVKVFWKLNFLLDLLEKVK